MNLLSLKRLDPSGPFAFLFRRFSVPAVFLGFVVQASASIITVPPNLNPGDQYRLVYITHDSTSPADPLIGDYNAFVTAQSNQNSQLLNLGATWSALLSTAAVNIKTNVGLAPVGIYRLDGAKVVNNTASLFAGSNTTLGASISLDQFGATNSTFVFTGTAPDGSTTVGAEIGTTDFIPGGSSAATNYSWLYVSNAQAYYNSPVYAISSVLTVPSSVPEPASLVVVILGFSSLLAIRKRRNL